MKNWKKASAAILAAGLITTSAGQVWANEVEKVEAPKVEESNLQVALENVEAGTVTAQDLEAISSIVPTGYTANNIFALSQNIEKVSNPKAKAALQKNIDKALAKWEEKNSEENETPEGETELPVVETPEVNPEENTEVPVVNTPEVETEVEGELESEKQAAAEAKAKAEEKQAAAEAKAEEKQAAAEAKAEEKQAAAEAKAEEKRAAAEARAEEKRAAAEARAEEKIAKAEAKAEGKSSKGNKEKE